MNAVWRSNKRHMFNTAFKIKVAMVGSCINITTQVHVVAVVAAGLVFACFLRISPGRAGIKAPASGLF